MRDDCSQSEEPMVMINKNAGSSFTYNQASDEKKKSFLEFQIT